MLERNVTLTLEKAREFYNSGNAALKEVSLQAFSKEELTVHAYKDIKTFEDACKALEMDMDNVNSDLTTLFYLEDNLGEHLTAVYKIDIIRKALNGADWKPKMTEGIIYYSWLRICKKSCVPCDKNIIGKFIADKQEYVLIENCRPCRSKYGIMGFSGEYDYIDAIADLGLLCCKSKEIAQYMCEQFGKLIFDAYYAQHVGLYQWI